MFLFSILRGLLRYGVTPAFLALAAINFHLETMGAGHGAHHHAAGRAMAAMPAGAVTEWLSSPALGSMWLMYLLMALAHAAPFLPKRKNAGG